jgi:hypothetical protein
VFPGSKLPDVASSPAPQSGNELPHSRLHAAAENGAELRRIGCLPFLRVSLSRTDVRAFFLA